MKILKDVFVEDDGRNVGTKPTGDDRQGLKIGGVHVLGVHRRLGLRKTAVIGSCRLGQSWLFQKWGRGKLTGLSSVVFCTVQVARALCPTQQNDGQDRMVRE